VFAIVRTDATCIRADPAPPAEAELPDVLPLERVDAPLLPCPPDAVEPPLAPLLWPPDVAEPPLAPLLWPPDVAEPPLAPLLWLPDVAEPPLPADAVVPDEPRPLLEDDEADNVPVTSTWCPTCCCMFCPSNM